MNFKRTTTTALALMLICTISAVSAAEPAKPKQKKGSPRAQADGQTVVRECAEDIGAHWDVRTVKRWADAPYRHQLDNDARQTEKMFSVIQEKLGKLKNIKSVSPRLQESNRALYTIEAECEKAPTRMLLELVNDGSAGWKLHAMNFNSKALAVASLPKETLMTFRQYVDDLVPKLGKNWSFEEFKAEADPSLLQDSETAVRNRFIRMTGSVGTLVAYRASQLVEEGNKGSVPFATYRAYFIGSNGPAVAIISVTLKDSRCKVFGLNIGKKIPPASAGSPQPLAPGSSIFSQSEPSIRGPLSAQTSPMAASQDSSASAIPPIQASDSSAGSSSFSQASPGGPDLRPSLPTPLPAK